LFQPLLYQVATAALSPGDIAIPVRGVFRDHPRLRVLCGQVSGVDIANRCITVDGRRLPYDVLVLATGASHGYFGHEEWAAAAPGLKSVNDATSIRSRILAAFEQAEATDDPVVRDTLLTFLICGAGPTGVELQARSRNSPGMAWKRSSAISTLPRRAFSWCRPVPASCRNSPSGYQHSREPRWKASAWRYG
jgi:NADH dehydrogenase FAD-containing subunit